MASHSINAHKQRQRTSMKVKNNHLSNVRNADILFMEGFFMEYPFRLYTLLLKIKLGKYEGKSDVSFL